MPVTVVVPQFNKGDRVRLRYPIRHINPDTKEVLYFYPAGAEGVIERVTIHTGSLNQVVFYALVMGDGHMMVVSELGNQIELVN